MSDMDLIKLSTGREIYANNYILGISPELRLFEGYDGGISDWKLSVAERIELANLAIGRWNRYKAMLAPPQIDIEELEGARALFEAYCLAVNNTAHDGRPIPKWDDLGEKVRYGWLSAYRASIAFIGARHERHALGQGKVNATSG